MVGDRLVRDGQHESDVVLSSARPGICIRLLRPYVVPLPYSFYSTDARIIEILTCSQAPSDPAMAGV